MKGKCYEKTNFYFFLRGANDFNDCMGVCEWIKIGTVFSVELIWKSMEL